MYKYSLTACIDTGILEKVGIKNPSIVGKTGHLPSELFNYFVLCYILPETSWYHWKTWGTSMVDVQLGTGSKVKWWYLGYCRHEKANQRHTYTNNKDEGHQDSIK